MVIGVSGGITAVGGAVKMLTTSFRTAVQHAVQPILHELSLNGGESFRDETSRQLKQVEARLADGDDRMLRMERKIDALVFNTLRGED